MKITRFALAPLLLAGIACSPKPEPAIEQATVNAEHSALRLKNSSTSRTVKVMEPGDKVEILEQRERWYRVRMGDLQGWMEARTLVTEEMRNSIQKTIASARGQVAHNTGTLVQDANLRIEPGRSTRVLRRIASRTPIEVLERMTVARDDLPGRVDAWLKIRSSPTEVGWVLSSFVEFDVPEGIAPYTEDLVYSTVRTLAEIEDPILGSVPWYVIGERRPGMDPNLDFDGIRVFTWNTKRQRYETAFRKRDLRGVYPLDVGQTAGKPTFRVHELGEDGKSTRVRNFVMNGVVAKEIK